MVGLLPLEECILVRVQVRQLEAKRELPDAGLERERGRENCSFPVEEGMGKPWVSKVSKSKSGNNNGVIY